MQADKIMHGLWGLGQMRFTKYIVVVDDDVDRHNPREVLFRLCASLDGKTSHRPGLTKQSSLGTPTPAACSAPLKVIRRSLVGRLRP